jgi:hypothetical protein
VNDEAVRMKAAEDLEAAERQIELLKAQIAEQEQHAEDVRHFLALYQAYQPAPAALPASMSGYRADEPSDNVVVAAFGGRDR